MLDVLDQDTDPGRVYRALIRHGRCRAELADLDVVVLVDRDMWAARFSPWYKIIDAA